MIRWSVRILVGLVLVVVLLVGLALTVGRPVLASLAVDMLRARGIPVEDLTIAEIGWEQAVLTDVVLDDGRVVVGRLGVHYDARTLVGGGLPDEVTIDGLVAHVGVRSDGTVLLPLSAGRSAGGGALDIGALSVLPTVTLGSGTILVDTPYGPATLPLEAQFAWRDGGLAISATLTAQAAGGTAQIPVEATIAADGTLDGTMRLSGEQFAVGPITASGIRGRIAASGKIGAAIRLDGALSIERVDGGGIGLRRIGIVASGTPGQLDSVLFNVAFDAGDAATGGADAGTLWVNLKTLGATTSLIIDADLRNLSALAPFLPRELPVSGALHLQADAVAQVPIGRIVTAPFDNPIAGGIRLSTFGLQIGDGIRIDRASIATDADLTAEQLTLAGGETWELNGAFGGNALPVALSWGAASAPRITIERTGTGWKARIGGAVYGTIDGYGVGGELSAGVDVDPQGQATLRIGPALLDLAPFSLGGLAFDPGAVAVAGSTDPDGWHALVSGDIELVDPSSSTIGASPRRATLSGGVEVRARGSTITIAPIGCLSLYAPIGEPVPGIALAQPATGQICPTGGAMLRWNGESAFADMAIRDLSLATTDGVLLDWGATLLSGDIESHLDVTAVDGHLRMPADGIDVSGLAAAIGWSSGVGWALGVLAPAITIDGIGPALVAAVEGTPGQDGQLALTGEVRSADGMIQGNATGSIDLSTGRGKATIDIPAVRFRPSGTQPSAIIPDLAELGISGFDGRIAATVDVAWTPKLALDVQAGVTNASFDTDFGRARGASGRFHVVGPAPIRLPPGQTISIDSFDAVAPVENVAMRFSLGGGGSVAVDALTFNLVGADVSVAPFSTGSLARNPARITVTGLALPRLLAQWPVKDLSATGTMDGEIPLRLDGDKISIDDGHITARGPGVISYKGDLSGVGGDPNMDLLAQAIGNFHYQSLSIGLNGGTGGNTAVQLSIRGSSPDVYDGYPISLNVNLTGALYDIIQTALETSRLGDRAREYFEGQSQRLFGE
jgi:hypothetical protein